MILIIHGNDLASSRDYYSKEKDKLESPILMEGESLTYEQVFQAAENKTFFDSKTVLAIENFFSKNKSNSIEFKKVIEYLNSNNNLEIIFWEDTEISKANQTIIKNASVKTFSYPQVLFKFLDSLKPGNSENIIKLVYELKKNVENELIFFMIIRQFRLMIGQLGEGQKIDEVKRLQSWQTGKLSKQASLFGKEKLVRLYQQLFEIDLSQKTGKLPYGLNKSIDIFLLGL
jgi:hypothetical protein